MVLKTRVFHLLYIVRSHPTFSIPLVTKHKFSYPHWSKCGFIPAKRLNGSRCLMELCNSENNTLLTAVGGEQCTHSNLVNRYYSSIPERIVSNSGPLRPYLELMRINKPVGCWFLFWPFGWSIAAAANPGSFPDMYTLSMFFLMAVIMRGAGCTVNDMWDKNIDLQVSRTKDRPLATNKLSLFDALILLGGQLGLGCLILLQYNFYTIVLSASSLVLAVSYPLMKRIIPWPQMVLGMAMNWGSLLGSPAVNGYSEWSICIPLYIGGICWTVVYDTIYAYQDIKDDQKLGLKSTALSFRRYPRLWLGGFSTAMISSLVAYGGISSQTLPYYCSLSLISAILAHQICTLDVNNKSDCGKKFLLNQRIGLILFVGIVTGNLLRSTNKNRPDNDLKDVSRFIIADKSNVAPLKLEN